jgi:hypothetical protein
VSGGHHRLGLGPRLDVPLPTCGLSTPEFSARSLARAFDTSRMPDRRHAEAKEKK